MKIGGGKIFVKIIISFLLITLVGLSIQTIFSGLLMNNLLRNQLGLTANQTLTQLESLLETYLQSKEDIVNEIYTSKVFENDLKDNDNEAMYSTFESIAKAHSDVLNTYVGLPTGKLVVYPKIDLPDGWSCITRKWYEGAVSKDGLYYTSPYIDVGTGKLVITVSEAVKDSDGKVLGVIGVDVSLEQLNKVLKHVTIGKNGEAFIIDNQGMFITDSKILGTEGENIISPSTRKILTQEEASKTNNNMSLDKLNKEITIANQMMGDTLKNDKSTDLQEYNLNDGKTFFMYFTNKKTGWKLVGALDDSELTSNTSKVFSIALIGGIISLLISLIVAFFIAKGISNPINYIADKMGKIADGDLTIIIKQMGKGEIGTLSQTANKMAENLRSLITSVKAGAHTIAASTEQTSAISEEIASSSENQSASAEETLSSMEQLDVSIQSISKNVQEVTSSISGVGKLIENMNKSVETVSKNISEVNGQASNTIEATKSGKEAIEKSQEGMNKINQAVGNLVQAIKGLGKSAVNIGEIVDVIDDIAEQTNLLALNAAIEAARAGEHGKGFAVVAGAIGDLAEKSGESTKEITKLIRGIQEEVNSAVETAKEGVVEVEHGAGLTKETENVLTVIKEAVEETALQLEKVTQLTEEQGMAIKDIVEASKNINDMAATMAATVQQQTAASGEVVKAIENVSQSANQIAQGTGEIATSTEGLAKEAQRLTDEISKFKL